MKISVIIPLFNSELYLPQCLDSILDQSLKDLEILIIDDGSEDNSLAVAKKYETKYDNIRVFQQQRKKQGAARNVGLEHAVGEYITFVDSDDWIPQGIYDYLYKKATELKSDFLTGILQSHDGKRNWLPLNVQREYFNNYRPNLSIHDLPDLLTDISVCNKFFKRSFIEHHSLRFIERGAGEDTDFMTKAYIFAKKITVLPKVVYKYCTRPNSRTGRLNPTFFEDRARAILDLKSFFKENNAAQHFSLALLAEVRKLVGKRFDRVVDRLPYDEQLQVCRAIALLTDHLEEKDIKRTDTFFLPIAMIRVGLIWKKEFVALLAFTKDPTDKQFLLHMKSSEAAEVIFSSITEYYCDFIKRKNKYLKIISLFRRFEKPVKLAKKVLKFFKENSFKSLLGISYYFALEYYYRYITTPPERDAWLIDERISTSAEDNSLFLFQYLCQNHPELNVQYVIKKNSPDYKRVAQIGPVISQYSKNHAYYLHRAEVLLSTDNIKPLAYPCSIIPELLDKTHNVFLQHGVMANRMTIYYKEKYPYFNQVIVTSELEKKIFQDVYKFTDAEISITGIARFDHLKTKRKEKPSRKVLIAPTWRKWLRNPEDFRRSQYFMAWSEFIYSDRLLDLAKRHNVEFYFRPHFKMLKYLKEFPVVEKPIYVLKQEQLFLQEYIKSCSMLITDYSSVMYDFFYQEKPTICYMFDRTSWEKIPHVRFKEDLPGDVVHTPDELYSSLSYHLENEMMIRPEQLKRLDKFFAFKDQNNCQRIYGAVQDKLTTP